MPLTIALVFAFTCEVLLALSSLNHPIIVLQVAAQQGFVSIDCGGTMDSYTDAGTKLSWKSDRHGFGLEDVSRTGTVSSPAAKYIWLSSMRIFEGNQSKYCYEFDHDNHGIMQSTPYLVRASFWIGDEAPFSVSRFKLLINADEWESIDISLPQSDPLVMEMYVTAVQPVISICVAPGYAGRTAFVSALELRPIDKEFDFVEKFNSSTAMFLYARLDLGSANDVRYPDDSFDRIWSADSNHQGYSLSGTPSIKSTTRTFNIPYNVKPPNAVLQTALVGNTSFNITFDGFSKSYSFLYYLFFAEISANVSAQQRVFEYILTTSSVGSYLPQDVHLPVEVDDIAGFYSTKLLSVDEGGFLTFSFARKSNSSLGPLVNALELLYSSPGSMSLGTNDDDVLALKSIKERLPRFYSWRGDPCLPSKYEWLTCDSEIRPHIIKLSLQNRNITTEIPAEIGTLQSLIEINMQGNNLSGPIPNSIAHLPNLTALFLQDNNLSGPIPQELLDKKVDLRLAGNPILCKDNNATYCGQQSVETKSDERSKKSYMLLVAVLAPTCAVVLILLALIFYFRRKHKNTHAASITNAQVIKYSNLAQHFTFQQIKGMTNDFNNKLGAGGFGDVFSGMLNDGLNVAVKVSSYQGGETREGLQFLNEVALLSRVHHKKLVEFVGYCIQPRLVLVYEYMAKGSLADCLHGKDDVSLSWRDRLKVVVGAAQGLEYLHKGCKPPIIHRDVKCSNILLDENLEGKISDFGISRLQLAPDAEMTVTSVQGTVGYIAPEHFELRITEKFDVFAFGVVLLEVVSGKRPFEGPRHITDWVRPLMNQSWIEVIVDPSIGARYNESSMWKVLEVAMACVEEDPGQRPDMHEVSSELKVALSYELQSGRDLLAAYDSSGFPFDPVNVRTR